MATLFFTADLQSSSLVKMNQYPGVGHSCGKMCNKLIFRKPSYRETIVVEIVGAEVIQITEQLIVASHGKLQLVCCFILALPIGIVAWETFLQVLFEEYSHCGNCTISCFTWCSAQLQRFQVQCCLRLGLEVQSPGRMLSGDSGC